MFKSYVCDKTSEFDQFVYGVFTLRAQTRSHSGYKYPSQIWVQYKMGIWVGIWVRVHAMGTVSVQYNVAITFNTHTNAFAWLRIQHVSVVTNTLKGPFDVSAVSNQSTSTQKRIFITLSNVCWEKSITGE